MRFRRVAAVMAIGVFSGLAGCDRKPAAPVTHAQVTLSGVTVPWFDGKLPVHPRLWTDAVPEDRNTTTPTLGGLLGKLHTADVARRRALEEDPVPLIVEDMTALTQLGARPVAPLTWKVDLKEEGFEYRHSFTLESGEPMQALSLAGYFSNINKYLDRPEIQKLEREHNLSGCLLKLGYTMYMSDSTLESQDSRIFAWSSAWNTAFMLREQAAKDRGDAEAAAAWNQRIADHENLFVSLRRANLGERNKITGHK